MSVNENSEPEEEPFKRCSCGHCYTRSEWELLALSGHMEGRSGALIELRSCTDCQSSMAVAARWSTMRAGLVSLLDP
jgi:hypothetical protein